MLTSPLFLSCAPSGTDRRTSSPPGLKSACNIPLPHPALARPGLSTPTHTFHLHPLLPCVDRSAIFPLASRLNHSCAPNLSFTYHTPSRSLHLYATAPLVPDQELSISYLSTRLLLPAAERQAHLLSSFGFQCVCASCTDQTGESDARRARIAELKTEVDALFPVEPQKAYTASRTLLVLCEEESLAVEAAFARATLAQIVIMWGGAEELAERLVEEVWRAFVCVRGEEGEDARRWARWRGRGQVGKHPRWGGLGRCEFAEEEVKVELKEDR